MSTKNRNLGTVNHKASRHVTCKAPREPKTEWALWGTSARFNPGLTLGPLPPQDQKIYIYSLKGMCPLNMPQRALDTPAVVTCFLAVPVLKKVRYWARGR